MGNLQTLFGLAAVERSSAGSSRRAAIIAVARHARAEPDSATDYDRKPPWDRIVPLPSLTHEGMDRNSRIDGRALEMIRKVRPPNGSDSNGSDAKDVPKEGWIVGRFRDTVRGWPVLYPHLQLAS